MKFLPGSWIYHKLRAASKLLRNWQVIVAHMQNYAEDVTNRDSDRAKAKGILKKLLQCKFSWFLHFFVWTLMFVVQLQASELNFLKHIHANQSQSLNEFHNKVHLENDTDRYMYKDNTLQNFLPDETLVRHKKQIVKSMLDCLNARFKKLTEDLNFLVCNAFIHKNWPNNDNSAVWQCISQEDENKGDFVNILKIIHLTSVYPLSNAWCKRSFSALKRTEDKEYQCMDMHPSGEIKAADVTPSRCIYTPKGTSSQFGKCSLQRPSHALACRDSFKEVPLFKKTDKLPEDLYRYYKYSSVRTASLCEVQKSFHEAPLNIK
ncbi:hypothetical protein MAR_007838 [Mya arenaria]|uniref:Uncharacterized protein n=1 Tax=Mya arenaria TaxID=6604 RepID=A0ABY7DU92_MYAAR|nr:hypothetical protein MAR_007838 [Mya arenaria]